MATSDGLGTVGNWQAFCKGKIASFKIPRYIKIVDEFPMTVTGKVQKFRMREAMIEELHLHDSARLATNFNFAPLNTPGGHRIDSPPGGERRSNSL